MKGGGEGRREKGSGGRNEVTTIWIYERKEVRRKDGCKNGRGR